MGTPLEIYTDIYKIYNTESKKLLRNHQRLQTLNQNCPSYSQHEDYHLSVAAIHPKLAEPFHTRKTHEA